MIDPNTLKVVDQFAVGRSPQHVVPAWDLRTLWVANNDERGHSGSLTPIDPRTGKPGPAVPVDDPYNLYFSPDGQSAIVVAEARRRIPRLEVAAVGAGRHFLPEDQSEAIAREVLAFVQRLR